jgi:hypothetical protein
MLSTYCFVVTLFCGCGSGRESSSIEAYFKRELETIKQQQDEWERQLNRAEEQDARYAVLLQRWEEQANRFDALLDRWDRIAEAIERRHEDTHERNP